MNDLAPLRRQSGFTLMEALVAMMVGIVILAATAFGVSRFFTAPEISPDASTIEASNITQIATHLKNLKEGGRGYADLTVPLAVKSHAIPLSMSQNSSAITSSWGDVRIGPASATDPEHYSITYQNVPSEACQQLVLKLRSGGWTAMTVNTYAIDLNTPLEGATGSIQSACNNTGNTLVFTGK